jgi:LuxR family maltose regulon positive regulatory protein
VLRLICQDKSNTEIGQVLGIKLPTVKTHVSHILAKLGVRRRSQAASEARRLRLV